MKASDPVIAYLKGIPSSACEFNIPRAHYDSHLNNFRDVYEDDNVPFWEQIGAITHRLLETKTGRNPRNIFLCGPAGCGKTHISVGLYRAMVQRIGFTHGGGVIFSTFADMIADIRDGFDQKINSSEGIARYTRNRVIFLDDITSTERMTIKDSLDHQVMRDIFINRWDSAKILVASTNVEAEFLLEEMRNIFTGHVVSRLVGSIIIQFPDQDLRGSGLSGSKKEGL